MNDLTESSADTVAGEFVYAFRPRAIGSEAVFRLGEHSLEWNIGGHAGRVAYPMIKMVRLGYRPSNLGNRRFTAEIWPGDGARIEIASASYRSLVAMDDLGPAYRAFIQELHRRIAAAGANCRFEAGFAAWRWWPMALVGVITAAALLYVAISTLGSGDFGSVLLIAVFIGLFIWQMVPLILRNRPRRYDPGSIPSDVMP